MFTLSSVQLLFKSSERTQNFLLFLQINTFIKQEYLKADLLCRSIIRPNIAYFYNMQYKSQVSPECVCEVSAQNTPHIMYYIILKMPILSGSRNMLFLCNVYLNTNELLLPAQQGGKTWPNGRESDL